MEEYRKITEDDEKIKNKLLEKYNHALKENKKDKIIVFSIFCLMAIALAILPLFVHDNIIVVEIFGALLLATIFVVVGISIFRSKKIIENLLDIIKKDEIYIKENQYGCTVKITDDTYYNYFDNETIIESRDDITEYREATEEEREMIYSYTKKYTGPRANRANDKLRENNFLVKDVYVTSVVGVQDSGIFELSQTVVLISTPEGGMCKSDISWAPSLSKFIFENENKALLIKAGSIYFVLPQKFTV